MHDDLLYGLRSDSETVGYAAGFSNRSRVL